MKLLIAPDSFKDCMSALNVARAVGRGFCRFLPETETRIVPMADGGEGTVESLIDATGGRKITVEVLDPLLRPVKSFFGITGDGTTAVIEMAAASGLELLKKDERNPWVTSTYGTGQLIRHALDRGCRKILLGIGGSATNDCGAGMASALGVRFLDSKGEEAGPGGGALSGIRNINMDALDPGIRESEILVACDVTNPLTGKSGASQVYGPQKGADPGMVTQLDAGLSHLSSLIRDQLGKEVADIPGAGAAGGLGAGLMAFLGGKLMKGFELVAGVVNLEEHIQWADLVITGEGRMDGQTRFGKTPFGVAHLARRYGTPVIGIAGSLGEGSEELLEHGFHALIPISEGPAGLQETIDQAGVLLERTGDRIGRLISLGGIQP